MLGGWEGISKIASDGYHASANGGDTIYSNTSKEGVANYKNAYYDGMSYGISIALRDNYFNIAPKGGLPVVSGALNYALESAGEGQFLYDTIAFGADDSITKIMGLSLNFTSKDKLDNVSTSTESAEEANVNPINPKQE